MRRIEFLAGLVLIAAPVVLIWIVASGSTTLTSVVVAAWIIASGIGGVALVNKTPPPASS